MSDWEIIIGVAVAHLLGVAVGVVLVSMGRSFGYWKAKCEDSELKRGEYGQALQRHAQIIHEMAQHIHRLRGGKGMDGIDGIDFDGLDIDDPDWWKKL